MTPVTANDVLTRLASHRAAGLHVDSRLLREVQQPGEMYLLSLPDASAFLALIWQCISDARPLVPVHQSRTLRDCASRLSAFDWRFEKLVEAGHPWFAKCVTIDGSFDISKFGWLALTPAKASEQQESPAGTHYIYDGVHKSIVLAKRLLRRQFEYVPVEALLLTPRRS